MCSAIGPLRTVLGNLIVYFVNRVFETLSCFFKVDYSDMLDIGIVIGGPILTYPGDKLRLVTLGDPQGYPLSLLATRLKSLQWYIAANIQPCISYFLFILPLTPFMQVTVMSFSKVTNGRRDPDSEIGSPSVTCNTACNPLQFGHKSCNAAKKQPRLMFRYTAVAISKNSNRVVFWGNSF